MPISYSFRPAWDARRKVGEVHSEQVSSPRPASPPKPPVSPLSLSRLSFPTSSLIISNPIATSSIVPPSTALSSFASRSQIHSSSTSPVSPVLTSNDSLDAHIVELHQVPNAYHRRFSSALHSSFDLLATPTFSSR